MKRCWKIALLLFLLIALAVTSYLAESSRTDWRKVSPFTAVEIEGEAIRVEFEGTNYELISIEKITTTDLIATAKERFGRRWDKRIREDIAEVLEAAGYEGTDRVDFELKNSISGNVKSVTDAKMTRENRNIIYQSP